MLRLKPGGLQMRCGSFLRLEAVAHTASLNAPRRLYAPDELVILVCPRNRGDNLPGNPGRENRPRRFVVESDFLWTLRLCTEVVL